MFFIVVIYRQTFVKLITDNKLWIFSQLEDYSLYNKKIFWEIWIKDEMTSNDIEIYKIKKNDKDNCLKDDKNYQIYFSSDEGNFLVMQHSLQLQS